MRRAAFLIALVYGLILTALIEPLIALGFWGTDTKTGSSGIFESPFYWVWLLVMVTAQFALLALPARVASGRPVKRRSLIWPIAAASLAMGILAAAFVFVVSELIFGNSTVRLKEIIALSELILVWMLWALIFSRWSKDEAPEPFIKKLAAAVYRGSILELLVAVPSHLIARQRTYCCAGADTFMGLVFGISVMIFSFGPGVFFLYARRIKGPRK